MPIRTVATILALVCVAALLPPAAHAGNECTPPSAGTAAQSFCVTFTVDKQVGAVPDTPYWDTYYLWVGPGPCTSPGPTSTGCRGIPPAAGSGVPLPTDGAVGAGVFGVLWKETNTLSGLQRQSSVVGGPKPADAMVLV